MTYQLIAFAIVIILYFFSISFKTRWIYFKLNIASQVILAIDGYVAKAGYDRAERHRFRDGWVKHAELRKQFAKRIVS